MSKPSHREVPCRKVWVAFVSSFGFSAETKIGGRQKQGSLSENPILSNRSRRGEPRGKILTTILKLNVSHD